MTSDDATAADDPPRVIIVGDGVAGLSAAIFTARNGLETAVIGDGGSILRRNAVVENYPGFPAGVDSRLLLEMQRDQARRAGALVESGTVERVERDGEGFAVETADGEVFRADYVVAATKNETDYLDHLDGVELRERGKTFVETDERGRTGVDGLYAAGRLAGKPHQAIVAAGHGAEVGVTLLEDDDGAFYHDWVAPTGYFTGRGREVPPGCEEVEEGERRRRERQSRERTQEYFAEPYPDEPVQHPSVRADEE